MEAKLKEYRALRRRKELLDKITEKEISEQKIDSLAPKILNDMDKEKKEDEVLLIENEEPIARQEPLIPYDESDAAELAPEVSEESFQEIHQESWRYCIMKWTVYAVIWVTLYVFFLKVGFGAVFFAFSILIGICLNTRTSKKKPGEVSAYSVFNQNCESIDGTLDPEDLQRQMLFGIAGIRL